MKITYIKTQSSRPSEYFYKVEDVDHKHPYVRKTCLTCGKRTMQKTRSKGFCSRACAKIGPLNPQWDESKDRTVKPKRERQPRNKQRDVQWATDRSRRRRLVLDFVKTTAGCADCGYNENPVAMQFDHVNGEKIADISKMVTYSWDKIWEEVMKCEVVCSIHHDIRTDERQKEKWGIS